MRVRKPLRQPGELASPPSGGTGASGAARAREAFARRFQGAPTLLVRAPGRVNLLGEHTDYNDGFVLPMAIGRSAWIALRPRDDRRVALLSLELSDERSFDLAHVHHAGEGWIEYVKGTAWALADTGAALRGWEGVLAGEVPVGAGLSSSAALEMASARAFAAVSDLPWEPRAMARICQRAENEWVGVQCGIMDQLIVAAAVEDHALLIDCRTLETTPRPLPAGSAVAVLDTSTRRGLADSAYNDRRAGCEAAARSLGAASLRDVTLEDFERRQAELPGPVARLARHVITENARTLAAAEAMQAGDAPLLGRLMLEGHASLRDDFAVSSPALDAMVAAAQAAAGCHGARMTGAGFAGCAVALLDAASSERFTRDVERSYRERTGLEPSVLVCRPAASVALAPIS